MVRFGVNKFTFAGNVGKDPELRQTPSGKALLKLSIATNAGSRQDGKNPDGTVKWVPNPPDWQRVTFWESDAVFIHKNCKKGTYIEVSGRVKPDNWTDKENVTHYEVGFVVDEISYVAKSAPAASARPTVAAREEREPDGLPYAGEEPPPDFNDNDVPAEFR